MSISNALSFVSEAMLLGMSARPTMVLSFVLVGLFRFEPLVLHVTTIAINDTTDIDNQYSFRNLFIWHFIFFLDAKLQKNAQNVTSEG
jgi:hypothetical protein